MLALDEPIAYIDVPRRVELTALLRDLARECGLAVLMTTHDLDLAIRTADTVWLLEPGAPTRLHVGAPEDLVLDGAVARAFDSDEVTFDLLRGAFLARPLALARCHVRGEGVRAVWTARALEREGVGLVDDGRSADFTVEVLGSDAGWRVTAPGEVRCVDSLGAVVAAVRTLLATQTPSPPAPQGRQPSAQWVGLQGNAPTPIPPSGSGRTGGWVR